MPEITSLGKWKQDQQLEVTFNFITSLRPAWATGDPDSKQTKKRNLITENKDLIFSYCHSLACKYQISMALDFIVFDK